MIRHRPYGSGHPYAVTGDQRVPAEPVDGEAVELRVRAAVTVTSVVCEWVAEGAAPVDLVLDPPAGRVTAGADSADGGHLAAAQDRAANDLVFWSVRTPRLTADAPVRYRFRAESSDGRRRTSRWYDVAAGEWVGPDDARVGHLDVLGDKTPSDVRWLVGPEGPRRVVFGLPLGERDHVVGFGERFDAVDQRGRCLDAVVFEQYKSQGRHGRTYLPMPFAMVVGSEDPWGFHVRTSRRTAYDVGAGRCPRAAHRGRPRW